MRPVFLVALAVVLVIALALFLSASRTQTPAPVAASPTAASRGPTLTPSPTRSATAPPPPSPTASPSPAGGTRYVNSAIGYSIELTPPWHRAACGASSSGPLEGSDGGDLFIAIPDRDFRFTDIGPNSDHVAIGARANPKGLTYRAWKSSEIGGSAGETVEDVTFAGRPALLVTQDESEIFLVTNAGYMYDVEHHPRSGGTTKADRAVIVRSFRFLTAEEVRAARASATPTPAPRSVEAVADILAEGFVKRDVTILSRVITSRCVSQGVYQDGVSSSDPQTYVDMLRDRFARGLAVEVQPRPLTTRGEFPSTSLVRATWREPGQPDRDTDLTISVERGTAYWTGTITYVGPRPP